LLFLSILVSVMAMAQEWQLKKRLSFENNISSCAKNNHGEIYLGFMNGALIILDKEGKELLYNSESNNSRVTSIDATNRLRPLVFRREQQTLNFIDRFNNRTTGIDLSTISQQFVWLCRQGPQNDIWLFTSDFLEILKFNPSSGMTTAIPLISNKFLKIEKPLQMSLFKNILILLDEAMGVVLFDQFGNYTSRIPDSISKAMDIQDQQIVLHQSDVFVFISPFDMTVNKKIKAPDGAFEEFLFLDHETVVTISENQLSIFVDR
ncbi:MAG: hypothetical protein RIA69_13245, partial [Cyclobacteriaceae bacterium]